MAIPVPGALIWLVAASAAAQTPPPDGWICRVAEELAPGATIELVQSVEQEHRYPIAVELAYRHRPYAPAAQTLRWNGLDSGAELADPTSLSLLVRLKKRDGRGTIRIDHDGGTAALPSTLPNLYRAVRGKSAYVSIHDRAALSALWASAAWRVSVLDRDGRIHASVNSALPARSAVEAAFRRLAPKLAELAAAPAGRCDEIGPDAFI